MNAFIYSVKSLLIGEQLWWNSFVLSVWAKGHRQVSFFFNVLPILPVCMMNRFVRAFTSPNGANVNQGEKYKK